MADGITRLAGGDGHELAVQQIRQLVSDARRRLLDQHPLFDPNTQENQ